MVWEVASGRDPGCPPLAGLGDTGTFTAMDTGGGAVAGGWAGVLGVAFVGFGDPPSGASGLSSNLMAEAQSHKEPWGRYQLSRVVS